MGKLVEHAPPCNRNLSKGQIAPIWSGEHKINQREAVRIEISDYRGQLIFDLRRCFYPDGESPRPTKRGVALALRHLPGVAALVNQALRQARALGLLSEGPP
jgi:Transcriptional Coactivator p15 (PC4)